MKDKDKYILPTSHWTRQVSELMVEAQAFTLPFESALAISVDAMQNDNLIPRYGCNDTIVNYLLSLQDEQEDDEVPYSENQTLIDGLVGLSNKLESICKNTIYKGSNYKDKFPSIVVEDILMSGDLVVVVEDNGDMQ